ncbi:hypothetical protein [Martelella mangrovi]|uniref:Uncharacterized protein n=1 Tax=Martelella mangrovi TaxID=1397477 RepID=A0ABV2IFY5_9HYPH
MSDEAKLQQAVSLLHTNLDGYYWIFGKGRSTPAGPLYALMIYKLAGEFCVMETENDDPLACVQSAIDAIEMPIDNHVKCH